MSVLMFKMCSIWFQEKKNRQQESKMAGFIADYAVFPYPHLSKDVFCAGLQKPAECLESKPVKCSFSKEESSESWLT